MSDDGDICACCECLCGCLGHCLCSDDCDCGNCCCCGDGDCNCNCCACDHCPVIFCGGRIWDVCCEWMYICLYGIPEDNEQPRCCRKRQVNQEGNSGHTAPRETTDLMVLQKTSDLMVSQKPISASYVVTTTTVVTQQPF